MEIPSVLAAIQSIVRHSITEFLADFVFLVDIVLWKAGVTQTLRKQITCFFNVQCPSYERWYKARGVDENDEFARVVSQEV
jgi:hypothetical protein